LTQNASEKLWAYHWPGNIRELENIIERAVILAENDGSIDVEHLFSGGEQVPLTAKPFSPGLPRTPQNAADDPPSVHQTIEKILDAQISLEEIETLLIASALRRTQGNLSAAARLLKLRRGQLQYRVGKQVSE
jgi:transcriptional regulator with PAS, ATPase and Fis domain